MNHNPLIVALDVPSVDEAAALAKTIGDAAGAFKIGLELYASAGPEAVRAVDGPVMLDMKLHDIPTTVERAIAALAPLRPMMLTVHSLGGGAMLRAASAAKPAGTLLLGVTILTSLDDAALDAIGLPAAKEAVPRLAALAIENGCDGVVCSPADLALVVPAIPTGTTIVTPGVRSAGVERDDQARVASPRQAVESGATHIVVGRPITRAPDPRAAAEGILAETRR
jgi:orotidine-5'-phosphate decarboxylase